MVWVVIIAVVVVIAALWVFLIFPGKVTPELKAPFAGRAFAHRGLYELDQSIPENSLPAFRRAVEAGYGAELDVQMTKDGQVVVFHDDDLKRGCGVDGRICDMTLAELRELRLFSSEERIPLFSEVLEIFSGKQPLIVELKYAPNWKPLSDATRKMLGEYKGPPQRLYRNAAPAWQTFMVSRVMSNVLARPQFIAYCVGPKPLSVRLCEKLGAMKVCWTARKAEHHEEEMKKNDAVIFEGYRP